MSDNVPTEQLLLKELEDVVDDWKVFGVSLGVPPSKLDAIQLGNAQGGVNNWKLKMFQFWLQSQRDDPSWKDVVRALEENKRFYLAATLSRKYLLAADHDSSEDKVEIKAEIRATAAVAEKLRDLESSFTDMLTDLLGLLTECECDLTEAQFYLDDRFDTEKFSKCTSFNALLRQLRKGHVDAFNTYYLNQLVAYFKKDLLTERIKKYEAKKEIFLKDSTVLEFQHAVVSKAKPLQFGKMIKLTIKISKRLADKRNLKDMEELALRGFGECQDFVHIHAESGCVIISWVFPVALSDKLEYLARKNKDVFKDAGVKEVTVGGRIVFPSTLEEDIPTASLKEIYTDFYHRLVEAVSDEHTCQSLLTQLSSPALISEEKIAQLTSSKVTGSSFLKTLGLKEEPHLLVPLVIAMSGVEQLQTLAEKMNSTLRSKQVTHEEEKVCLKEVYSAFYHQLVDAISDEQVCQSLSIQLRLSAVIPEEKISQLISSRASGSSFLNILGVEEQSDLVAVLIKSMSAVEQLQTLAREMNDFLRSKQEVHVADTSLHLNIVTHEEDKVCLKEVYSAFYHQLVGAISDEQVCQSLSTQLRSSAVIPEEKISQLISSRASGSSFLNILGVEEQSDLVAVLIKSMSAVEQLQTLAREMNDFLRSKQEVHVADTSLHLNIVTHEEDKVCLKEVYSAFYHQLVGAISDEQVCQSLSTQLRSSAVIPEEKISQLISSRASGSSFLNILGVEEQSGLVAVLIKSMSAVEQLQTLAREMNDFLRSKQEVHVADTSLHLNIEQQLKTEMEQLRTDNKDLLAQVKLHKDDLTAANELLIMREKVLSAMIAHGKDPDPNLREERSRHLEGKLQQKSFEATSGEEPMDFQKNNSALKEPVPIIDLSEVPDDISLHYNSHLSVLVTALSTVYQWFPLGIHLGLNFSLLKIVEEDCKGVVESCKIEMLVYWLKSSENCNKQLLQNALKQLTPQPQLVSTSAVSCPVPLEEPLTAIDLSKVPDGTLDMSHMAVIVSALKEIQFQWFPLGIHLGLDYHTLKEIEMESSLIWNYFCHMLGKWLSCPDESKHNKQLLQNALKRLTPRHAWSSNTSAAQQLKYYQPPVVSHPIPLEEPVLIIDLSDLPDGVLGTSHLHDLFRALHTVYQWFSLGINLGLSYSTLQSINIAERGRVWMCKVQMLREWLVHSDESKRSKQFLQNALKQLTPQPQLVLIHEKPLFSMSNEQAEALSIPQTDSERQAVKDFSMKVQVVIQTCNEAEYYAALERLNSPRIENYNFDKPVDYPHSELSIVVGTFAGIDAAIIAHGANYKAELETVFRDVCTNAKLLLRLGVCFGLKFDLKFADVLVASEIGVSQLDSDGLDPREEVQQVAPSMHKLFCRHPNTWDGIVVCKEPNDRIARVYVGRLFGAINDPDSRQRRSSQEYLGREMEGWAPIEYTPEIKSITIKGIASFVFAEDTTWQLTAAKAAVDYAHHKLERAGYIDFDNF